MGEIHEQEGGAFMTRVYVAGAYSGKNVIEILDNMRRGMRAGTELMLLNVSPFVPWLDYHFQLMLREGEELTVEHYYKYSMAWLEVSDVVVVLPNSENSKGTQAEIARARELGIPVLTFEKFIEMHKDQPKSLQGEK
jgi:hypothetical protein